MAQLEIADPPFCQLTPVTPVGQQQKCKLLDVVVSIIIQDL